MDFIDFNAHSRRTIEMDLLGRCAELLASTCHYCLHDYTALFSRTNEHGELIIHNFFDLALSLYRLVDRFEVEFNELKSSRAIGFLFVFY